MTEIDVSGCVYIYKNTDCLCGGNETSSVKCNDNVDCIYKQLKRLEAENAELKNKYNENITVNTQLQKWQDEDLRQIAQLEKELDLFRKLHNNVQTQRRILAQKLEKIKEIASKYSQREDYLLGGLFAELVDELLSEVLKDV